MQTVQVVRYVIIIICYFGAGAGFMVAIRLIQADMGVPGIANKLERRRQLGIAIATVALVAGVRAADMSKPA